MPLWYSEFWTLWGCFKRAMHIMLYAPQLLLLCLYVRADSDTLIRDWIICSLLACKIHVHRADSLDIETFRSINWHTICRFESINSFTWAIYAVLLSFFSKIISIIFISFHPLHFSVVFLILYSLSSVHFILIYFVCASDNIINHTHFGEYDINSQQSG